MAGTKFTITTNVVMEQDAASSLAETLKSVTREFLLFAITADIKELSASVKITPQTETVFIEQDACDYDPLDSDEPFIMYCKHPRYNLGHTAAKNPFEENDEGVLVQRPEILGMLPLYLYDHSGITMRTSAFNCSWDSVQVGWIYYTQASLDLCGTPFDRIEDIMKNFVKNTYAPYLEGQIFSYKIVDEEDEVTDSSCGFVGYELKDTGILDCLPAELHDSAKAAWENRFN